MNNTEIAAKEQQPLLIDERAAANLLGLSPRTVWSLSAAGQIPFVRIGRRKLYSLESLRAWIRQRETLLADKSTAG